VPTYNRRPLLERVTAALLDQTLPSDRYELLIVDDGSTDDTPRLGAELSERPNVRFLRGEHRGPAPARNLAVREACGDVVAFTDDDCLMPRDWLERLLDGYARHPDVVGVGGRLVPNAEALASSAVARYEEFQSRCVFGAGDEEAVGGFECPAGGTNNMSYRRDLLLEMDGFDESFGPRVWGEDADLKYRITQSGGRLLYVPVTAIHLRDYGLRSFLRQSVQRGRSETHFLTKHEGGRGWLRLVRRLALSPVKLAAAPFRRDPPLRAVMALGDLASAVGALLYRPPAGLTSR
jgi:glycosyltransferase involved in cell wall biosynthesis